MSVYLTLKLHDGYIVLKYWLHVADFAAMSLWGLDFVSLDKINVIHLKFAVLSFSNHARFIFKFIHPLNYDTDPFQITLPTVDSKFISLSFPSFPFFFCTKHPYSLHVIVIIFFSLSLGQSFVSRQHVTYNIYMRERKKGRKRSY